MSYDISNWSTKKLDGLTIPLMALQHVEIEFFFDLGTATVRIAEGGEINGEVDWSNLSLLVREMKWISGEGSGTDYDEIVIPTLAQSTGHLLAIVVWEGGDSIRRLEVNDGEVSDEPYCFEL